MGASPLYPKNHHSLNLQAMFLSTTVLKLFNKPSMEESVKVTQSCLTLCDPMDYTVHGILQAKALEWVAEEMADAPRTDEEPGAQRA